MAQSKQATMPFSNLVPPTINIFLNLGVIYQEEWMLLNFRNIIIPTPIQLFKNSDIRIKPKLGTYLPIHNKSTLCLVFICKGSDNNVNFKVHTSIKNKVNWLCISSLQVKKKPQQLSAV